jgi:hypothetical protein
MESIYSFLDTLNEFADSLKNIDVTGQELTHKIHDLPEGQMKDFFKQSLKEANEGTLNIQGFIQNIERFKDAN